MNVLHLTISLAPGGRRSAIITLAANLVPMGVHCELGGLHAYPFSEQDQDQFPVPATLFEKHRLVEATTIDHLLRFCAEHAIDVVHTHDAESQLVGALLRLRAPHLRLLMTFHRSLPIESKTFRARARNAFAAAFCGAIVTGSQERRDHFLEQNYVPAKKLRVIPFGTDVQKFHPEKESREAIRKELNIGPETTILGTIGHFGEEKGVDRSIRAFQALCRVHSPDRLALLVLGDGRPNQTEALRALAAQDPQCQIIFAGFQRDVERWQRAFDLFLHLPRLEAFGLVLIEAMASELPIIATRVGGIPEIVRHQSTGLLVPNDDAEPQAVQAALSLVRNPELRIRMGREGRRVAVAEYTSQLSAERHLKLYQELVAG